MSQRRAAKLSASTQATISSMAAKMVAMCSGTPVLASRIDGNVGLLGDDYAGLFEPGNPQALADLLLACRSPQTGHALVAHLQHQCALRAPLFEPSAERAALHHWVQDLWTH